MRKKPSSVNQDALLCICTVLIIWVSLSRAPCTWRTESSYWHQLLPLGWQKLAPFGHPDPTPVSHWGHNPGCSQQQSWHRWCHMLSRCCLLTWWHIWRSGGFLLNGRDGREGLWPRACSPSWSVGALAAPVPGPCQELTWVWSVCLVCPDSSGRERPWGIPLL